MRGVMRKGCLTIFQIWPHKCTSLAIHWTTISSSLFIAWVNNKCSGKTVHLCRIAWTVSVHIHVKHLFLHVMVQMATMVSRLATEQIMEGFVSCEGHEMGVGCHDFFFFWFGFYGPFKNISLISSLSLIRGGGKTVVPGEKPPDLPVQNLTSHMWPERGSNPQRWEI